MKAWSDRTKKDKAARLLVSLYIVGTLVVGLPIVVRETYDYAVAGSCRDGLSAAIGVGVTDNMNIMHAEMSPQQAGLAYAESAREFAAAVAAVRCPTSIAPAQDELVAKLLAYAATQESRATANPASEDQRRAATEAVGEALYRLQDLGIAMP